jgi:UDP-N-acetylmuramoyl-tripeptide--D-alanyl-D-alanine ligase
VIKETLHWAAQVMGGELLGDSAAAEFTGVSTDTREMKMGNLFFCLVAGRDGHEFVPQARAQGAAAVVIDRSHQRQKSVDLSGSPTLVVEDTLKALGDLAHAWRRRFAIPILALTGSNGKTTTKELLKAVLTTRYRVMATEGNFNNLIGVPKTLFRLGEGEEIAVIEMGMNDFGEIDRLTEITQPNVGLITNVAPAHLEKLKDVAGVAKAKGELFAKLTPADWAVINQKDAIVAQLPTAAKRIPVGNPESGLWGEVASNKNHDDFPLHLKVHCYGEEIYLRMKLPGPHNLDNVLLALAVAHHFQVPLKAAGQALEAFAPAPSRMQWVRLGSGVSLIDDCYNANPASTLAALATLQGLKHSGKSLAVLGDMNELGEYRVTGHRQVGMGAAQSGVDFLVTVGNSGKETLAGAQKGGMHPEQLRHYPDVEAALALLKNWPQEVLWVLVKGSRTVHLEKLVSRMKEQL